MKCKIVIMTFLFIHTSAIAQDVINLDPDASSQIEQPSQEEIKAKIEGIQEIIYSNPSNNGLSAADIDTLVLRILTSRLRDDPAELQEKLDLSDLELVALLQVLSSARSFTIAREARYMQAACNVWLNSASPASARVNEALLAYEAETARNSVDINERYQTALLDIESSLDRLSRLNFSDYLNFEREVMAGANITTFTTNIGNLGSGIETLSHHCGGVQ